MAYRRLRPNTTNLLHRHPACVLVLKKRKQPDDVALYQRRRAIRDHRRLGGEIEGVGDGVRRQQVECLAEARTKNGTG